LRGNFSDFNNTEFLIDPIITEHRKEPMGTKYQFNCKSCKYEREISGGPDQGMFAVTKTISCRRCKQLFDVIIGEYSFVESEDEPKKIPCRCPGCGGGEEECADWRHPGPCPQCGEILTREFETMLWD